MAAENIVKFALDLMPRLRSWVLGFYRTWFRSSGQIGLDNKLLSKILAVGRARPNLARITMSGYSEVMERKEALPAALPEITSLRDFGGCYLVHGRYLLHATEKNHLSFASMIDVSPTADYLARVESLRSRYPKTEFETIRGDFREKELFSQLRHTDASILYEVILHQENYVEVMRNVAATTRKYICVAQPCIREDFFMLPAAAVLLQFWDSDLKDLLRQDSFWPKEPSTDRFLTSSWMWGQTTSHLIEVMRGLGWALRDGCVVDNVCGPCWEYPLIVFEKK